MAKGEFNNLLAHREVVNGLNNEGELAGFNTIAFTDTGGAGLVSIRGESNCITTLVGNTGASLTFMNQAKSGRGDGKSPPANERGTQNAASNSADKSKASLVSLQNVDNSGMTLDGGGGRPSTIQIMLGDGKSGITITEKALILQCNGVVLMLDGETQVVKTTYALIQEMVPQNDFAVA